MLQKTCATLLALLILAATSSAIAEGTRFPKVKKLKAIFLPPDNQVKISWKRVGEAKKYRFKILSADSQTLLSGTTKKRTKKVDRSIFSLGSAYTVKVSVLAANGFRTSKAVSKQYTFETQVPSDPIERELTTTNSSGRSGSYYLPKDYSLKTLPVLVAFHGQGGEGADMVGLFKEQADAHGFIVVAPSSRIHESGIISWEVSDVPGEGTPDYEHALACIAEVLALENVSAGEFMATGVSAGGSSAAFLATNDLRFSAMAILHGGIFASGFGDNRVRAWFSTGSEDELRTPAELKTHAATTRALGFPEVTYMEYDYGHVVKKDEQADVIDWWLGSNL